MRVQDQTKSNAPVTAHACACAHKRQTCCCAGGEYCKRHCSQRLANLSPHFHHVRRTHPAPDLSPGPFCTSACAPASVFHPAVAGQPSARLGLSTRDVHLSRGCVVSAAEELMLWRRRGLSSIGPVKETPTLGAKVQKAVAVGVDAARPPRSARGRQTRRTSSASATTGHWPA
jgi:hypothetical protein